MGGREGRRQAAGEERRGGQKEYVRGGGMGWVGNTVARQERHLLL